MAILNFNLDLDKEYIDLLRDIYKVVVILIVFQTMIYYSNFQKTILNSALGGTLLNDDFMTLLIYAIISVSSYYLIFDKLISIN